MWLGTTLLVLTASVVTQAAFLGYLETGHAQQAIPDGERSFYLKTTYILMVFFYHSTLGLCPISYR